MKYVSKRWCIALTLLIVVGGICGLAIDGDLIGSQTNSNSLVLYPTDDVFTNGVTGRIYPQGQNLYALRSADHENMILMRFELGALPQGAQLTSAQLKLKYSHVLPSSNVNSFEYQLYQVTSAWSEQALSQDSLPALAPEPFVSVQGSRGDTEAVMDLLPIANQWVSGNQANYGIAIRLALPGPDAIVRNAFYSFENIEDIPVLEVEYR